MVATGFQQRMRKTILELVLARNLGWKVSRILIAKGLCLYRGPYWPAEEMYSHVQRYTDCYCEGTAQSSMPSKYLVEHASPLMSALLFPTNERTITESSGFSSKRTTSLLCLFGHQILLHSGKQSLYCMELQSQNSTVGCFHPTSPKIIVALFTILNELPPTSLP